ncbi:hypothetical protein N24_2580 [Corynebacterium suranareeae]|uniref:Secreted protein n=1 Tax=Corynebacterium suranareeae TaxID=2506452 RepID=A0A169S2I6_9CORY|nr:neocarzinostatin apoprotein domain-containing protein [Corynebacterium suranareeae]BAU96842.1 hypothetical protein N24_2580 [Corynebacterium suranareeae]
MTVSIAPKRAISALLGAAFFGSALLTAAPAFAQTAPVVSVTPNQTTYSSGQTVQVKVTGLEQDTDYRLGLCTVEGIAPTGAPACAETVQVDAQADSSGEINASVTLVNNDINAHGKLGKLIGFPGLPGQPDYVNLSAPESANITVAEHLVSGGGIPVAYSAPFNLN